MSVFYFDTSVLLPVLVRAHKQHDKCIALLQPAMQQGEVVTTIPHTLAELYSNLTKLPHNLAIPLAQVLEALALHFVNIFTFIDLTATDYLDVIQRCADKNLVSGIVYDALHLQAAIKAKADVLYTANYRDIARLWSDDLSCELVNAG